MLLLIVRLYLSWSNHSLAYLMILVIEYLQLLERTNQMILRKVFVYETDLLVVTPEKLDLLLRARPELLDIVKIFVLDEAL